jgi:hypothetical protein
MTDPQEGRVVALERALTEAAAVKAARELAYTRALDTMIIAASEQHRALGERDGDVLHADVRRASERRREAERAFDHATDALGQAQARLAQLQQRRSGHDVSSQPRSRQADHGAASEGNARAQRRGPARLHP